MSRNSFVQQALLALLALVLAAPVGAKSITLRWDPSPSAVSGYKIYYQSGSAQLPYNGRGADQGESPVDVGNNTEFTLTGLADEQDHYFTVSAYDAVGNESGFSNQAYSPGQISPPPPIAPVPIPEPDPPQPIAPAPDLDLLFGTTAGDLDSHFGDQGLLSQLPLQQGEGAPRLVVQTDGKFLLLGDATLSRYGGDGRLDQNFGAGGLVDNRNAEGELLYWSADELLLQQDGKILLLASSSADQPVLLRYLPDGHLDPSFADKGRFDQLPLGMRCFSLAQQADGRILLAGDLSANFAVVRLTSAGHPDTSFGNNGVSVMALSSGSDTALDLALQADGKIVVVGQSRARSETRWPDTQSGKLTVSRLLANGWIDRTFGSYGSGVVVLNLPYADAAALKVLIREDSQILLAGYGDQGTLAEGDFRRQALLVQFNADGRLETGFGVDGMVRVAENSALVLTPAELLVQEDGKILLLGSSADSGSATVDSDFFLTRLQLDGTVDRSFASEGVQRNDLGGIDRLTTAALQTDGKILVAGLTDSGPLVVRYLTGVVGGLQIAAGQTSTTQRQVRLDLHCRADGPCSAMRFSSDQSSWSAWQPYAESREWQLAEGAGQKSVYVEYRGNAGDDSSTTIYAGSINLVENLASDSDCRSCHSWDRTVQNNHHRPSSYDCFSCHYLETDAYGGLGLAQPSNEQCLSCHTGLDPKKPSIYELHQ